MSFRLPLGIGSLKSCIDVCKKCKTKKPSFENLAFYMGRERFERSTNGLKVRCSTD